MLPNPSATGRNHSVWRINARVRSRVRWPHTYNLYTYMLRSWVMSTDAPRGVIDVRRHTIRTKEARVYTRSTVYYTSQALIYIWCWRKHIRVDRDWLRGANYMVGVERWSGGSISQWRSVRWVRTWSGRNDLNFFGYLCLGCYNAHATSRCVARARADCYEVIVFWFCDF